MSGDDQIPCAVVRTDAAGRITEMNGELRRIVGADTAATMGGMIDQLLPPASRIFLQTHIWPLLLRDGAVRELYLHLRGADAARVPVMLNAVRSEHGTMPGYVWVMFVARERSLFEAELIKARNVAQASLLATARQLHFARAVADLGPGAIAFLDLSSRCQFGNARFDILLGTPASELSDAPWETLMASSVRPEHRRAVALALGGAEAAGPPCQVLVPGRAPWWAHFVTSRTAEGIVDGCFVVQQASAGKP